MKSNIQVFVFCAVSLFNSETSGEWAGLAHSKIFYGETFTTIAGVSFQACMDECSSRAVCMSLNYNRKLLRCQLNSRAANDVTDLVQARGYLYVGNKQVTNFFYNFMITVMLSEIGQLFAQAYICRNYFFIGQFSVGHRASKPTSC